MHRGNSERNIDVLLITALFYFYPLDRTASLTTDCTTTANLTRSGSILNFYLQKNHIALLNIIPSHDTIKQYIHLGFPSNLRITKQNAEGRICFLDW